MEPKRDPTDLVPTVEGVVRTDSPSPAPLDDSPVLQSLVMRGLRREGAGKLCKQESSDSTLWADLVSAALVCSALVGLLIFGLEQLGWSFWGTLLALVLTLFGALVLAKLATPLSPTSSSCSAERSRGSFSSQTRGSVQSR